MHLSRWHHLVPFGTISKVLTNHRRTGNWLKLETLESSIDSNALDRLGARRKWEVNWGEKEIFNEQRLREVEARKNTHED